MWSGTQVLLRVLLAWSLPDALNGVAGWPLAYALTARERLKLYACGLAAAKRLDVRLVDNGGSRMLARLHTLEATPEQYEAGLRIVRDDLLPWARESSGFSGVIGLVDHDSGKAFLVTLWADEEARAQSAAAAERLSALAADASGADWQSIENFDVSLFEVLDRGTTNR